MSSDTGFGEENSSAVPFLVLKERFVDLHECKLTQRRGCLSLSPSTISEIVKLLELDAMIVLGLASSSSCLTILRLSCRDSGKFCDEVIQSIYLLYDLYLQSKSRTSTTNQAPPSALPNSEEENVLIFPFSCFDTLPAVAFNFLMSHNADSSAEALQSMSRTGLPRLDHCSEVRADCVMIGSRKDTDHVC
jgi:hypothetical protein